jgi:dienelactone hydrolase
MRCRYLILAAALLPAPLSTADAQRADRTVAFDIARDDILLDEPLAIVVSGLAPRATVVVRARNTGPAPQWTASATFVADENGRVDLSLRAPVKGSYKQADAMGLFWSAERAGADAGEDDRATGDAPDMWTLAAEVDGAVAARAMIHRRAVARNVRVRPVRDAGMVGTFYEPPGDGRHPAFLVLGGSGGGLPPPSGVPGGLASRGYAVLALAYFGAEGLPRSLSNIPLEYFGTALRWLAAQPSVDGDRIGVVGASRGAELALLLGTVYAGIHTVVAYMPSDVVWPGCCDVTTRVAWTIGGRPLAAKQPGMGRGFTPPEAEIPVERIQGAVLLISGKDDGVWPSAEMAGHVIARLRRHNFAFASESLVYDHAGHGISRPYTTTMELNSRRHPLTGRLVRLGGTPEGTEHAREDSWTKLLAFVDQHLRDAR